MKITLAKSAGFCFGVKRAVDTVYEQLEMSAAEKQPIYTFGPITVSYTHLTLPTKLEV